MKDSTVSLKSIRVKCEPILPTVEGEAGAQERFSRVPGTDLDAAHRAMIELIGCGGLGSHTARILVRKEYGTLVQCDPDVVGLPNLGTQGFFREDLYQNKALALARNLRREATGPTTIIAYPLSFQAARAQGRLTKPDVSVVLVDNNDARIAGARRGVEEGVPVATAGVGRDGTHGYVFVQERGQACFGCLFPEAVTDRRSPCPGVPTCIDILQILAALVAYAVDSIVMQRLRRWNYRTCNLAGILPDAAVRIERRPDCPLCGGR